MTPASRCGATVEDENVAKVHFQQTHSRYGDKAAVYCSAGTRTGQCVSYVWGVRIFLCVINIMCS